MSGITTYFLEMTSLGELRETSKPEGLEVLEAEIKEYRFNRFLYSLVGEAWSWKDKLETSDEDWEEYAESDDLRTWVAYRKGSIAGYYELQSQPRDTIEIAYFGLAPRFIGQGLGGYLLSHAIRSAWSWGDPRRVWVHTCSLDHPGALANYQARGFRVYKTERS